MKTRDCVYLALDGMSFSEATKLARETRDKVTGVKIHELYDRLGPGIITTLKNVGARTVWVDAKLHDTPNIVRMRAQALKGHGADILTVHASGGIKMMRAAKECGAQIFAVTVLTSLGDEPDQDDITASAIYGDLSLHDVLRFGAWAKRAGMDGLVCSPLEIGAVAAEGLLQCMIGVTPGVRSPGADTHDQARIATPAAALREGAKRLVIGRQVTSARDPVAALDALQREIEQEFV